MDDEIHWDSNGRAVYWDGTPVWRPAEGSRFERWDHTEKAWVQITCDDALTRAASGLPYRYVLPGPVYKQAW